MKLEQMKNGYVIEKKKLVCYIFFSNFFLMVYKHIVVFLLSRCDRTTVALVVHKCCSLLCLACPHMWSSLQPDLFGTLTCPLPASCWAASWECLEFLQEVSYKYASCDGRRVSPYWCSKWTTTKPETSWSHPHVPCWVISCHFMKYMLM